MCIRDRCGSGALLYHIGQSFPKATLSGTDVNVSAAKQNSALLPEVELFESELDTLEIDRNFDVIVSSQLLEHLEDPWQFVKFIDMHSHKSTHVIIDIPNISSGSARLFGKNWIHLDTPRHRVLYTKKTIEILFSQFTVRDYVYTGSNVSYWASLWNLLRLSRSESFMINKVFRKSISTILDVFINPDDKVNFTLTIKR